MQPMYYIGLDVHKRQPSATAGCVAQKSAGNTVQRTPLSKQRNKHLQTTLVEAAKMPRATAPTWPCCMTGKNRKVMPIAPRWR